MEKQQNPSEHNQYGPICHIFMIVFVEDNGLRLCRARQNHIIPTSVSVLCVCVRARVHVCGSICTFSLTHFLSSSLFVSDNEK